MDFSVVTSLIGTLGFPIASCIVMAYYVKYITDKCDKRIEEISNVQREESHMFTEALNNNTLAIQKLYDFIESKYGEVIPHE